MLPFRKCAICHKNINGLGYYGRDYVKGMTCFKCYKTHVENYVKIDTDLQKKKIDKSKCLID